MCSNFRKALDPRDWASANRRQIHTRRAAETILSVQFFTNWGCKPKPPKIPSGSSGCLETLAIEHGTNPIFQSEIPELPGRSRCRLNPGEVGPVGARSDPAQRTESDPANVFVQRSQWPIPLLRNLPSAWPVD